MKPASTIDQQIIQAYADLVRKEKIIIHLDHLKAEIKEETMRLAILKKTMQREEQDYLRLEEVGIHRLFYPLTEKEEVKLDREKQEFLLVYLKHQECEKGLQQRLKEQKILMDSLYDLFEVEKKLDQLLIEKRKRLSPKSESFQLPIADLEEKIIRNRLRLQEIQEAQMAGKKVLPLLQKIMEELKTIKQRGAFDYAGKGRYSSFKKKKFIERAAENVSKINSQLRCFQQELQDVSTHYDLQYEQELRFFKDFIDDFLQKLVTDWGVKKQVTHSLQAIEAIVEQIKATLANLESEVEKARFLIGTKQEQVKALLLKMAQKKDK